MIQLGTIPENQHQVLYLLRGHLVGQANQFGDRVAYSLKAILSEREEYQLKQRTALHFGVDPNAIDRVGMSTEQNKRRRKQWESLQKTRNGRPWRPNVMTQRQLAELKARRQR